MIIEPFLPKEASAEQATTLKRLLQEYGGAVIDSQDWGRHDPKLSVCDPKMVENSSLCCYAKCRTEGIPPEDRRPGFCDKLFEAIGTAYREVFGLQLELHLSDWAGTGRSRIIEAQRSAA